MNLSRSPQRDEEGSILLLALGFLTAVAFMVTALIGQSDGSFRATVALRQVQRLQYASDAAVQDAIVGLQASTNPATPPVLPPTCGPASATCPPTFSCPTPSGTTNPVNTNYAPSNPNLLNVNNFWVRVDCVYLKDVYGGVRTTIRTYQITAWCTYQSGVIPVNDPLSPCPPVGAPLLRANVTLSQYSTNDPVVVTVNDWSVTYGSSS